MEKMKLFKKAEGGGEDSDEGVQDQCARFTNLHHLDSD